MRGSAGTARAWWRFDGQAARPRHREGRRGEGPSLAITAMFSINSFMQFYVLSR